MTRRPEPFIAQVPWRHVKMVPVGERLEDGGVRRWGRVFGT